MQDNPSKTKASHSPPRRHSLTQKPCTSSHLEIPRQEGQMF